MSGPATAPAATADGPPAAPPTEPPARAGEDPTSRAAAPPATVRAPTSPTVAVPVLLGACGLLALAAAGPAVLLAAVVVLAALLDRALVGRPGTVARTAPALVARGTSHLLTVTAERTGRATLRQPLPAGLRLEPDVAPAARGLDGVLHADRRGAYVLPPVLLRRTGPLRLVRRDAPVGPAGRIDVYPDVPGAARMAAAVRGGHLPGGGRRQGPLGLGTEFEAVRDYDPDDDVRQVNWLATWRTGRPMSNQYRVESERDVLLLLDCGRVGAAPGAPGATLLDASLDALTAVAAVADGLGDRVGVVAFDARVRVEQPPAIGGGARAVRALHAARSAPVDADYAAALRRIAGRRRAFVLLLTDLVEPAAARALGDALPLLRGRHLLHVVSPREPALEALLRTPPTTLPAAAAQAAAADAAHDRELAEAALARAGVRPLSAPPDALAAACVRAYLTAKRLARV